MIVAGAALFMWPVAWAVHGRGSWPRGARRAVQRRRRPVARVLIVGDRAAVAADGGGPRHTLAGRLAAAHPSWTVGNLARTGSRISDVARLLARMVQRLARRGAGPYYDAIVIHAGSHDALRFTREGSLSVSLVLALAAANELARHAFLVTGGTVALVSAFPPPWSWLFGWKARRVRDLFRAIAWEAGVQHVEPDRPAAIEAALRARLWRTRDAALVLQ